MTLYKLWTEIAWGKGETASPSSAQWLDNRITFMLIHQNLSSALEIKTIALDKPEVFMLACLHRLSFNLMANSFENILV